AGREFLLDVGVPTLIVGGFVEFLHVPIRSSIVGKFRNEKRRISKILRESVVPVEGGSDTAIRRRLQCARLPALGDSALRAASQRSAAIVGDSVSAPQNGLGSELVGDAEVRPKFLVITIHKPRAVAFSRTGAGKAQRPRNIARAGVRDRRIETGQ